MRLVFQAGVFFLSSPLLYRGGSVEEDGVGVSVGDVRHVFQNVFLSDDSQQPPGDRENRTSGKSRLLHIILCPLRHRKSASGQKAETSSRGLVCRILCLLYKSRHTLRYITCHLLDAIIQ